MGKLSKQPDQQLSLDPGSATPKRLLMAMFSNNQQVIIVFDQ